MSVATSQILICTYCDTENDPRMPQCIACDRPLDPSQGVTHQATERRPFHWMAFGTMAGVALVLVMLGWFGGATTSLVEIEPMASNSTIEQTFRPLVENGDVEALEAAAIGREIARNRELIYALDAGSFAPEEAARIQQHVRRRGQSVVLGVGGWRGLAVPLLAFGIAGLVVAVITRVRRWTEVTLASLLAAFVQLGLWFLSAEFKFAAVLGGRFVLTGGGLLFEGSPIMLLGMALVVGLGGALVASTLGAMALPALTGTGACHNCTHRFALRPKAPENCPKCHVRLKRAQPRSMKEFEVPNASPPAEVDEFVGGPDPAAPSVAGPLLCCECAQMYEGGKCPTHPDEPLLDPTLEYVRMELAEADHRARRKMSVRLMFGGTGLAMAFALAVGSLLGGDPSITMYVFAGTLSGAIAVANVLAPKLSPPRFTRWSGEEAVDLDALGEGAQAQIYGPLYRAFERAKRRAIWIGGGTVAAAVLCGVLALIFDLSIGPIALLGALAGLLVALFISSLVDEGEKLVRDVRDVKRAWKDPYSPS